MLYLKKKKIKTKKLKGAVHNDLSYLLLTPMHLQR